MENFNFYSPTFFAFGKDRESDCGELVKRFGGKKVLIHYGGGSVVRSGLLDRVKASLDKASIEYVELGGVMPNPRSGLVYEGIELCKKENVDFILAVGGGSTKVRVLVENICSVASYSEDVNVNVDFFTYQMTPVPVAERSDGEFVYGLAATAIKYVGAYNYGTSENIINVPEQITLRYGLTYDVIAIGSGNESIMSYEKYAL